MGWEYSYETSGIGAGNNTGFDANGVDGAGAGFYAGPDGIKKTPVSGGPAYINKGSFPSAWNAGVSGELANQQFWFQVDAQQNVKPVHRFPWIEGETEHPELMFSMESFTYIPIPTDP